MDREPLRPVPFILNVPHGKVHTYKKSQNKKNTRMEIPNATKFPITRAILWNRSPTGKSINIRFSNERKIQASVSERALLLAAKHGNSNSGFLVGSFISESDGIFLQVDRFDPGRNIQIKTGNGFITRRTPTAIIPGDHVISLKLNQTICKDDVRSTMDRDTVHQDIEVLKNRVSKKHPVSLPDLFISRASCHCQADINELIVDLSCYTLSFGAEFVAVPINDIPIIPTALAKNLSGPLRLTHVQGNPKFGYLTMDQTRKLLLLLETDPKADSLPLVGIWISGTDVPSHPFVWACCLRFVSADYIQERVFAPPSSFLLVHYPTTKAYPDFYECQLKKEQDFESKVLLTCREQVIISKSGNSKDDICLDLECNEDLYSRIIYPDEKFQGSAYQLDPESGTGERNLKDQRDKENEDVPTPRPSPKPFLSPAEHHPRTPSVPELSLIDEQPLFRSAKKPYNPMVYQEMTSTSEFRGEESKENKNKTGLNQGQDESRGHLGKVQYSSADFEQTTTIMNLEGNMSQSSLIQQGKDSIEKSVVKIFEQDENFGKAQGLSTSDLISSKPESKGSGIRDHEHINLNTDGEERGMHALSKIADHEKQLMELQEQIRELISMKRREEAKFANSLERDRRSYESTAVQCSMIMDVPEKETIGVNTGDSLLFTGKAALDTGVDTCHCCSHCRRSNAKESNRQIHSSRREDTEMERSSRQSASSNGNLVNVSNTDNTYSFSDIREGDIEVINVTDDPASAAMQSFASDFQGVDLPVFDDSQNNEQISHNDITLGTSASMVDVKEQPTPSREHSPITQVKVKDDSDGRPNSKSDVEFYMEMVEEVKGLLSDQREEEDPEQHADTKNANDASGEMNQVSESWADETNAQEGVKSSEMVNQDSIDSAPKARVGDIFDRKIQDVAIYHPRINYESLLGAEISDDANVIADEIALKYLTSQQIHNIQYNVTQKTKSVKFEGVLHDESVFRTPKVSMNFVSMNVSCNMSIASRRYMQKYNLLDGDKGYQHQNIPACLKQNRKIHDVRTVEESSDKENEHGNILDLNKLKGLPKLM